MKVTKESVMAAVAAGAVSLSGIGKHMGVKGNISGSMTKQIRALVPEIAGLLAANKGKAPVAAAAPVKAKAVKVVKAVAVGPSNPKMSEKAKAYARYEATHNPFESGCMKAIVFEHGSKSFRPLSVILAEAANDPRFKAYGRKLNHGKEMPMEDFKINGKTVAGRYQRAYWSYTMIRGNHPGNHGVTDWDKPKNETRCKGHERVVKAVMLPVAA